MCLERPAFDTGCDSTCAFKRVLNVVETSIVGHENPVAVLLAIVDCKRVRAVASAIVVIGVWIT